MGKDKSIRKSSSELLSEGLAITRKRLIAEEKKKNGYLIIADKDGKVIKVPASQLK